MTRWRVSVATVATAGPFSAFAGVDRVIVSETDILDGIVYSLTADSPELPLQPFM